MHYASRYHIRPMYLQVLALTPRCQLWMIPITRPNPRVAHVKNIMPTTKCEPNANEHIVTVDFHFPATSFRNYRYSQLFSGAHFQFSEFHLVEFSYFILFSGYHVQLLIHHLKDTSNVFSYVQRWDLMLYVDFRIYGFICYVSRVRQRPFTCMNTATTQPHGRHTHAPQQHFRNIKNAFQHINKTKNHIYKCRSFQKCLKSRNRCCYEPGS